MDNLITEIDICEESKECFLTYAEEVLTDRAIPSAEDGLLSVHRKILWTSEDLLKLDSKAKYKKSASIVGSTLASSYYHGDAACYGALCKMAQPYLMRYPLIDGEGNFGTQEGNGMEAASRYTNSRPSIYADLMFNNFKKNVVPVKETYNGEYYEPVVLPALFPNALVNGKESIGISMSHNSLPNNLTEVCDGIIAYIKNPTISIEELMNYIKGPDFPLGNVVINSKDILNAYKTGRSSTSLKVRGDYIIDGQTITFTSIPYRTYRDKIKEQINKNIDILDTVLEDFNDFSNIGQNKLVFKVKKGINPESALNKLFSLTDLQTTLSYNMNYIVNGTPKLCSLIDLIEAYVNHQHNILINAATFDREKALNRIHILQGLLKAIDKINEVIELIKNSANKSEANKKLIDFLAIDEIQANAILDMKLSRLTKIDKNELVEELNKKEEEVKECNKIIEDKSYRNEKLIAEINNLKNKYGDKRRTQLLNLNIDTKDKEIASVVPEDVVVITSRSGNIKRIPKANFRIQRKGGVGVKSIDEAILSTISTNTTDILLLFTNKGKMYRLLVDNIPVGTNSSKGVNISSLISLDNNEEIISITNLSRENQKKYIVFITKQGLLKKSLLSEYTKTKRNTGISAITLKENDSIVNIELMDEEEMIIITKKGQAVHIETRDVAAIGRTTMGIKAIKLREDDEVIAGLPIVNDEDTLAIFLKQGLGKKVSLEEFPLQGKAGIGVKCSGDMEIAKAIMVKEEDNVLITGDTTICFSAKELPFLKRTAMGNLMIKSGIIKSAIVL